MAISLAATAHAQEFLDRIDSALSSLVVTETVRMRLSGSVELEGYRFGQPPPGLLFSDDDHLFNPRLALYLDADAGPHVYAFAHARLDRGFDPEEGRLRMRLDEYAVRYSPGLRGAFHLQAGRFGTVVGNWVPRHGAWANPFVTAPLPYENLTGIWDTAAVRSPGQLLGWAHVPPAPIARAEYQEKALRVPVIWGPAYATGIAAAGQVGSFDFAVEWKNSALSADPGIWDDRGVNWRQGSVGGRIGFRPNEAWTLGVSASEGPYLRESAAATVAPGARWEEYRQLVLGHDIGFAWHRWQFWGEIYVAQFRIPTVARADTVAGYVEAKYKIGPRLSWAVRWNGQAFANFPDGRGNQVPWGRRTWRVDLAPSIRFSAHTQLKLQYSLQHEAKAPRAMSHTTATQLMVRF